MVGIDFLVQRHLIFFLFVFGLDVNIRKFSTHMDVEFPEQRIFAVQGPGME
jgi:hypothetical protein